MKRVNRKAARRSGTNGARVSRRAVSPFVATCIAGVTAPLVGDDTPTGNRPRTSFLLRPKLVL